MKPKPVHYAWYGLKRWHDKRNNQLREHPLCAMCIQDGIITAATVADHVVPHRGNPALFWYGKLQSLCQSHHNKQKSWIETRGYVTDVDSQGYPCDPAHPFNK